MAEDSNREEAQVVGIRFHRGGKVYDFARAGCGDLAPGDFAVVDTARGRQIGEVVYLKPAHEKRLAGLKSILYRATGRDLALRQHWEDKAEESMEVACRMAKEMGLDIKLATAEYTLDGRQLTFLYASGKKQDANALRRRLAGKLDVRVEFWRVGPRDHAKLCGGCGPCGRLRCCACFLADFTPISIRMGKDQGISLTPSEITGMCGRLRCCLSYEHEMYVEASKGLPSRKARVHTPYGSGKVIDLLPLRGAVVVQIEDRRMEVPAEEVEVISR
ncbi:MAG: regulatory iron-sulfur-containing complex subunit RicT [Anaerolineae bacterium]|jgi:cell fate regulator YaaT (PSP1 superfamily)